jgi:hypothetical protein
MERRRLRPVWAGDGEGGGGIEMGVRVGREQGISTCRSFSSIGSHFFVLFGFAASYAHLFRWRAMDERDASKPKAAKRQRGGSGDERGRGNTTVMRGGRGRSLCSQRFQDVL